MALFSREKSNQRKLIKAVGPFGVHMLKFTAAIINADHKFHPEEKFYVRQYLEKRFGKKKGQTAFDYLVTLVEEQIIILDVCKAAVPESSYETRLHLMYLLFGVAAADNIVHPDEIKVISAIADGLQISRKDYESLHEMYFGSYEKGEEKKQEKKQEKSTFSKPLSTQEESAYRILGVEINADSEVLKKAYRELAKQHHPDKVAYLGEEHAKTASEKFAKIQNAYEYLTSKRRS